MVFLTQKVINNLRVQWAAEPKLFGYRVDEEGINCICRTLTNFESVPK